MKARKGVSKRDAFLAAFRVSASITQAAADAGIERSLHYRWLDEDEEYALAFEDAKREAAQALEDEAVRRAHAGILEPVIFQGQQMYEPRRDRRGQIVTKNGRVEVDPKRPLVVRKQSDALLMFLLKGTKPEKYRESFKGEITTSRALRLTEEKLAHLTEEEIATLIAIQQKLATVGTATEGASAAAAVED